MRESGDQAGDAHTDPSNDAARLARLAAQQDARAWSSIFDRHFRTVFAFVRHRLASQSEAEDVAAQVFEVGFSRAASFDYRGVPIEAWLLGIARNLVRDQQRRSARYVMVDIDDNEPPVGDAADDGAALALRQDIRDAMLQLTDDQQTVITLRFLLDRSVADTARIMERSEDAVKLLQRRALAALQRRLGAEYRQEGVR